MSLIPTMEKPRLGIRALSNLEECTLRVTKSSLGQFQYFEMIFCFEKENIGSRMAEIITGVYSQNENCVDGEPAFGVAHKWHLL